MTKLPYLFSRQFDGIHDMLVASAAAKVARKRMPDLLLGRVGILLEEGDEGQQNSGGAIAALQAMRLPEGLLDRMKTPLDPA